jgi:hypothetical protein
LLQRLCPYYSDIRLNIYDSIYDSFMIDESLLISVNMVKAVGDRASYVAGDDPARLQLEFFKRTDTGALVTRARFGPASEGAPGLAHGASVSAALSEAMIFTAWSLGHAVLPMRLSTTFKQMVPLGATATIETTGVKIDGPKISMKCVMTGVNGGAEALYAESEGFFMAIPAAKFGVDGQKVAQMFAALS